MNARDAAGSAPDARLPAGGWIDLDDPPAVPPARRHPFRWVLALAALAGLAVGGTIAAVTAASLPSPPPSVVARVVLDGLVMDPVPSAVLRLTVDNRGTVHQSVRDVVVSGGGTTGTTRRIGRAVAPSRQREDLITVPLRCPRGTVPSGRLSVVLRLASDAGQAGAADVTAVPVGRVAEVGGLCTAADAGLPAGWRTPAHATAWRITGNELDLTVTGMPPGLVRLVSVESDGVLLPPPRTTDRTSTGGLHLVVAAPEPGCRDGGFRPVLATGVQLRVETADGLGDVYVPLGAEVAQWFMDSYVRACPAYAGGPPAVWADYSG